MFDLLYYIILGLLLPLGMAKYRKIPSFRLAGIEWNIILLLLFIVTVLLRGLAYNTGQDYMHYYDYYENVAMGVSDDWGEHVEAGYRYLVSILSFISSSPTTFFIFSSLIVIGSILRVSQQYGKAAGWIMFFWWIFLHGLSFNLYRQYYAISFMLLGYIFLSNKNYLVAFFYGALAFLFHTSSVIPITIIVFVFFLYKWNYSKWLPISAVVLTTLFSQVFQNQIAILSDYLSIYYYSMTGQLYDADRLTDSTWETSILSYPIMITSIIFLWYGYAYCKQRPQYKDLYNIFAISLILMPITRQEILMRICHYFVAFSPIFLGLLMSSKYRKKPLLIGAVLFQFAYYCYGLSQMLKEFPLQFN